MAAPLLSHGSKVYIIIKTAGIEYRHRRVVWEFYKKLEGAQAWSYKKSGYTGWYKDLGVYSKDDKIEI